MSIIETKKISDILQYADSDTLVLLDVDQTLIEPASHVGGSAWFDHITEKLQASGVDEKEAIEKVYDVWMRLQDVLPIRLVEAETPSVVKQLHDKQIKTVGLTARGFMLADLTNKTLKSVGIHLDAHTIHDEKIELTKHVGFYNGVLSIEPYGNKGERLISFFEKINYLPKKVLFVDDFRFFLEQASQVLRLKNIQFTGVRYGGSDDNRLTFDPAIADQELRDFLASLNSMDSWAIFD